MIFQFLLLTLALVSDVPSWSKSVNLQSFNTFGNGMQRISVFPRQAVRLMCGSSPDPLIQLNTKVVYQWEKPLNQPISFGWEHFIKSVEFNDAGVYTCRATYRAPDGTMKESVRSTELSINSGSLGYSNLQAPPMVGTFQITISGITVTNNKYMHRLNDQLYMQCSANHGGVNPSSQPNYRYEWIKPNSEIINSHVLFQSRFSKQDYGRYSCVVYNADSNMEISRKTFNIEQELRTGGIDDFGEGNGYGGNEGIVGNSAQGFDQSYQVVITSYPASPIMGQKVMLTCAIMPFFNGNVRYEWRLDNDIVSNSATYQISRLEPDIIKKDLKCIATINGRSYDKFSRLYNEYRSREISLNVPPGPHIVVKNRDKKELHCEIDRGTLSNSRLRGIDVKWLFNGAEMNKENLKFYNILRTDTNFVSILSMQSVSTDNEGKYECRIDGSVKEAFIVVLLEENAGIELNPKEQIVSVNDVAEFHCRILNLPGTYGRSLTWFFLGDNERNPRTRLQPNWERNDPESAEETSFISLRNVQTTDDGFYLCESPQGKTAIGRLIVQDDSRNQIRIIVKINPNLVRVPVGSDQEMSCTSTNENDGRPYGQPMWRFLNGREITSNPRFRVFQEGVGRSRLMISSADYSDDNAMVECYVDNASDKATFIIDRSGANNEPFCDPVEAKCEFANGSPPQQSKFSVNWKCDGEDDCGNKFDETDCQTGQTECGGTHFNCRNQNNPGRESNLPEKIPRAFQCDGENDCGNNQDEMGCQDVIILQNPINSTVTRQGGWVTLTCQAKGVPAPMVIWRYNWRCLPDTSRMTTTQRFDSRFGECDSVTSTLTINSIRTADDGIYNCEAISGKSRIISRESILKVEY